MLINKESSTWFARSKARTFLALGTVGLSLAQPAFAAQSKNEAPKAAVKNHRAIKVGKPKMAVTTKPKMVTSTAQPNYKAINNSDTKTEIIKIGDMGFFVSAFAICSKASSSGVLKDKNDNPVLELRMEGANPGNASLAAIQQSKLSNMWIKFSFDGTDGKEIENNSLDLKEYAVISSGLILDRPVLGLTSNVPIGYRIELSEVPENKELSSLPRIVSQGSTTQDELNAGIIMQGSLSHSGCLTNDNNMFISPQQEKNFFNAYNYALFNKVPSN